MVEQVVVGFDGSASALAAARWGAAAAKLHGARLVVCTVVEGGTPAPAAQLSDTVDGEAVFAALRTTVEPLTAGYSVVFRYGGGKPAADLVAACREADILAAGFRSRNPIVGLLLGLGEPVLPGGGAMPGDGRTGTRASGAARRAGDRRGGHLGTLPPGAGGGGRGSGPGRGAAGVDTSEHSRRALAAAAEARVRGAVLHAIHAVHWDHLGAELVALTTRQLVAWGKDLVAVELANSGVAARPVILNGHPPDVVLAENVIHPGQGHTGPSGISTRSKYGRPHAWPRTTAG
ncbi:universal stress protein [Dactylosporangium sp. NBC_01737]|uniref:universal stress protein n=1 Tax=Dactylosporangium sp. NBC_01737 TaxID=2975959 RepID=UPI002E1488DD|nr:universal stress protein [Dactylosporangium sp. NBC_01737]